MKIFNPVSSGKASGRALGGVFSFNRGMATFKKYVKSYNPNTEPMRIVKERFAYLTKFWKAELTYEEITLWNEWNLPWTDIYGDSVSLTGINKFVICNDILLRAEKTLTRIPPTATPAELTVTPTADTTFIKLSIDGITDAEVNAQSPFLEVQVPGTPSSIVYIEGQYSIYWNGMLRSRRPLEKNWKTIFYHDCRTGFEGIEELKIIIQTDTSLKGLQPIRIQRFNKWGYWSGQLTYINAITLKNLITNGTFDTDADWDWMYGTFWDTGHGVLPGVGRIDRTVPLTIGRTYKVTLTVHFTNPGGFFVFAWQGKNEIYEDESGTYSATRTITDTHMQWELQSVEGFNGWVDDVFLEDITP